MELAGIQMSIPGDYLVVPAKTQQGRWYNGFRLK